MESANGASRTVATLTVGVVADADDDRVAAGDAMAAAGFDVAAVSALGDYDRFDESVEVLVVFVGGTRRGDVAAVGTAAEETSLPIVVVAPSPDRRAVDAVLQAGAQGIVPADAVERALAATVAAVACGQVVVPLEGRSRFQTPALSFREKQVLGLVVMGYTNSQIAHTLYLAESTVKSHLSSSFDKLGVRSRNEAARLIVDSSNGLGTGILTIAQAEPVDATLGS